ncbi:Inner membrane protein YqiK [hydrothermal vent metagenome]|uniref:Inner membrane protein YqiK n=1 Tax=hydrothermal vent metagenome TaxID=652676 RepID=A0A3B0XJD2_9ZZZZ
MEFIFLAVGVLAIFLIGGFFLYASFYKKVNQGYAMIVSTTSEVPIVTFTGRLVIPVLHRMEIMNISLKTIEIDRRGKDGLICKDNIRADIKVAFFVRINNDANDVRTVAQSIGCERASDQETLEALFSAKFSEALKTVGKTLDFVELYQERDMFRDKIKAEIGTKLNGYSLEDAAIDYLEQTLVESLDKDNILDAQGIRKITELTSIEHISTNNFMREEQMKIKKKDVETRETILELERQEKDAEARQQREVSSVIAREEAETKKIQEEERLKFEQARINTEEKIEVAQENKEREVEVANLNRQRVVVTETEQVKRAQELEVVERERAVELEEIDKEKALEVERKNIADVIRDRVVVEKSVAIEEEETLRVRLVADAQREKEAAIVRAEGEAQEALVKEIKAAEADEKKAIHRAKEYEVLAGGRLKASELDSQAKIKEAEGIEAVQAAPGLADVRVQEARADADEKTGLAEAKVLEERLAAQAVGDERVGVAAAKVKEADAAATRVMGEAEASKVADLLLAQATGDEKVGIAAAKIKEADAAATKIMGEAQASKIADRFAAEAQGLEKKFIAMQQMDDNTRSHEEFRMDLDLTHEQTMLRIKSNVDIAHDQAEVLSTALGDANIDIVGGNGEYFEKFVNALAVGKSIDGVADKSKIVTKAIEGHMQGDESFIGDIKEIVSGLSAGSGNIQNLTVSAFLSQVMKSGNAEQQDLVKKLMGSISKDSEA